MNPLNDFIAFLPYAFKHPRLRRAAWCLILFLAIDLLAGLAFWLPLAVQTSRLEQKIDGIKKTILDAARSRELSGKLKTMAAQAENFSAKYERDVTQAELVRSLGRLAAKDGLKILSQDFSQPGSGSLEKGFRQALSMSGSYPAFRGFFNDLEDSSALTLVEKARLERVGAQGEIRVNLDLVTYSQAFIAARKGN